MLNWRQVMHMQIVGDNKCNVNEIRVRERVKNRTPNIFFVNTTQIFETDTERNLCLCPLFWSNSFSNSDLVLVV